MRHRIYASLTYTLPNEINISPQSKGYGRYDTFQLYFSKTAWNNRLTITAWYYIPLHFVSGYVRTYSDAPGLKTYTYSDRHYFRDNQFGVRLTLRLQGGKSVRFYNRHIANE